MTVSTITVPSIVNGLGSLINYKPARITLEEILQLNYKREQIKNSTTIFLSNLWNGFNNLLSLLPIHLGLFIFFLTSTPEDFSFKILKTKLCKPSEQIFGNTRRVYFIVGGITCFPSDFVYQNELNGLIKTKNRSKTSIAFYL